VPVGTVREALQQIGYTRGESPPRPLLHAKSGTLVSFALLGDRGVQWVGLWIDPEGVPKILGDGAPGGPGGFHGLSGVSAQLFDLFAEAARRYLEKTEEVDSKLALLQERTRALPVEEIWRLQREMAVIRAHIGRALVAAAECGGPSYASVPGFAEALPSIVGELSRVQDVASNVRQALSDLVLLRNAEDSNKIAEIANILSRSSNRIAALANTSNIRMLGLTYLALVLAVISGIILFPNTAATILGMPSAAWVPGLWVDVALFLTAIIPLVWVLSRSWVRRLLRELAGYEMRAVEGVSDLPEISPAEAERVAPERVPVRTPPGA
jgi:hypothetical protein